MKSKQRQKWRWMYGGSSFNYTTLYRTVYMM